MLFTNLSTHGGKFPTEEIIVSKFEFCSQNRRFPAVLYAVFWEENCLTRTFSDRLKFGERVSDSLPAPAWARHRLVYSALPIVDQTNKCLAQCISDESQV